MARKRTIPLSPAIQRLLEVAKLPDMRAVAETFGFPLETVRSWDKRSEVSRTALKRIATQLGVPVAQLEPDDSGSVHQSVGAGAPTKEFGSGALMLSIAENPPASYVGRHSGEGMERAPAVLTLSDDGRETRFQVVPRFAVRASAGNGNGHVDEEQIGEVAFEVNWMRRHLGRAGRGFASIEVRGDSMQPTLIHGDEIIIDKHVHRVDVNGIYVIALRGDLLVKRIQRKLDGSLVVKSDNDAYDPETIGAEQAEEFRVVGRMVWPRVR